MESLWPHDFGSFPGDAFPLTILREQAYYLGQATRNVVEGEVITGQADADGQTMRHDLYAVAPALGVYRVRLCSLTHDVAEPYPVQVSGYAEKPVNEMELRSLLRSHFNADHVKKAVASLQEQSLASTPA